MNIISLFPTAVGLFDLGRAFTEEELSVIMSEEKYPNMGNCTSKYRYVLQRPELKSLHDFVQGSITNYFNNIIAPSKDVSLYVTQSWINYSEKGQWHHAHEHPNSILSGVFYIQTDETDKIFFEKNTYEQITFPTENWNLYNSKTWWVEANLGRLIIFPSSLRHHVDPVLTDHTRVSMSFNTFARGLVGTEENLTALHLI
jgi:uncharacterized protein (TIGR02466 family)